MKPSTHTAKERDQNFERYRHQKASRKEQEPDRSKKRGCIPPIVGE
ncbi:14031_t:CDS:2, partial [Acaulospora morrowiae]